MNHLTLGSESPRRRELLAALGIPFDVVPARVDESLPRDQRIEAALETVALRKAREVSDRAAGRGWTLAADTAVVVGSRVFGKPAGRGEAVGMLQALSGLSHRVITAVALLGPEFERCLAVETEVVFGELSESQIEWYTQLEEPYDKAGAYAIQGRGAFMVAAIHGSYTNVVGLPMAETVGLLEGVGFAPWRAGAPVQEAAGV
jgi:septum formation protein